MSIYYGVTADIVTDAMVVSIPILLLHRTTLSLRQKASVGAVLCLSFVMIAISLVRGISAPIHGTGDEIWASFWIQLESCVATIMVSLSSFRQLFVGIDRSSGNGGPSPGERIRDGWRRWGSPGSALSSSLRNGFHKVWWRKASSAWSGSTSGVSGGELMEGRMGSRMGRSPDLPRINVGATITGMRTMIRESGRTVLGSFVGRPIGRFDVDDGMELV